MIQSLLNWLSVAPQGAIATLTAILTATTALIVAFITQWILGRRARTELLTKKLEDLYLSLNDVLAHNLRRVEETLPLFTEPFKAPPPSNSSAERQGLDLHKRIIMYVRLYFPKLSIAHQKVFRRNRAINDFIYQLEKDNSLEPQALLELSFKYRDAIVAMEEEIIKNRNILVKDHFLFKKYKASEIKKTGTQS